MTAVVDGFVVASPHRSQFDRSTYADENCGPTTVANGANTVTSGRISKTGGDVRKLVKRSEETKPKDPGWSIPDCVKAAARLGVPLIDHSQDGIAAMFAYLDVGYYVLAQGDSDQFGNQTCSGAFNGPHCIGINPAHDIVGGRSMHWINDPICPSGRWEWDDTLRHYVAKIDPRGRFAIFRTLVPRVAPPTDAPPPPDQGGTMPGIQFRILEPVKGIVTVTGSGHALIRVDNAALVGIPAGQQREVAARIVLTQSVPGHATIAAGTTGYLVGNIPGLVPDNSIAAMVLEKDGTFVVTP